MVETRSAFDVVEATDRATLVPRGMATIEEEIDELAELLVTLRERDPRCLVYGSRVHRYRPGTPRSEAEIFEFERAQGVRMPDQLRCFLARIGDGGGGPGNGIEPLARWAFDDPSRPFTWDLPADERADSDQRDGVFCVSHAGCANDASVVVTGPSRGSVWMLGDVEIRIADTVVDWYRTWAETKLRRLQLLPLVERLRLGMTREDLEAATGQPWTIRATPGAVYCESLHVPAQVRLGSDDRAEAITRRSSL